MNPTLILSSGSLSLGLAALAGRLPERFRHRVSATLGIVGCLLLLIALGLSLYHSQTIMIQLPLGYPLLTLMFRVDPLAAFFGMLIAAVALPVNLYAYGYFQTEEYQSRQTGLLWALIQLFCLSMLGVVLSNQVLCFLIFWEIMALLSFLLIISDTRSQENQQAGFLYLVMTHIGTAALMLMFYFLSHVSGSLVFSDWIHLGTNLSPAVRSGLFVLALIGFGAKAGLVPLHVWLPEAHPAAPGPVSALMSGVMIKTAVYGLIRIIFEILSPFPYIWGVLLVVWAIVMTLLGIVYASETIDMKRLLAFSSIENIGLILLPIGIAMLFQSAGLTTLAQLALVAGLFHTLNHALFKSLLFLAASAVVVQTHTRNLDAMGGLIQKMPRTAGLFLIGSLSLCSFPPFNGFVSKWLIYQTLLTSYQLPSPLIQLLAPVIAAVLGVVGALSAATLVKAFSTAFLAMPRSAHARHVHDASPSMQCGMAFLAAACLGVGIQPAGMLGLLGLVADSLIPVSSSLHQDSWQLVLQQPLQASLSPSGLLLMGLLVMPLGLFLPRILGQHSQVRREDTWSCGVLPEARFEHTASGFQQPLKLVFGDLQRSVSAYWEHLYQPFTRILLGLSLRMSVLQSGNLNMYLAFIFVTLILTLLWVLK